MSAISDLSSLLAFVATWERRSRVGSGAAQRSSCFRVEDKKR